MLFSAFCCLISHKNQVTIQNNLNGAIKYASCL